MQITFGLNPIDPTTGQPGHDGPGIAVTGITDAVNDDGSYIVGYIVGTDAAEIRDHLFDHQGPASHLPGNEAILDVFHTLRPHLADGDRPLWVHIEPQARNTSSADDFERFLADFYRCARGIPDDVEQTHHTLHGNTVYPPGTSPEVPA